MPGKLLSILVLITCTALISFTPQEEIKNPTLLDVPRVAQKTRVWCWAASGEMVLTYMGHPITQCDQAEDRLSRTDCCDTPIPEGCVKGGWPQLYRYGFTSDSIDAPLSWEALKKQIDNGKPVLFAYYTGPENPFGNRSGHMMVAVGYAEPHWIYANNPFPIQGDATLPPGDYEVMTYERYVKGKGDFGHWRDYYNIQPRPEPEITEEPASPTEDTQTSVDVGDVTTEPANEEVADQVNFVSYDRKPVPIGGYQAIQRAIKYPAEARIARWKGRAVIKTLVDETGTVKKTQVLQSSGHPELDEAAITAIHKSKWKPAMQRDKPVPVWVSIPFDFKVR